MTTAPKELTPQECEAAHAVYQCAKCGEMFSTEDSMIEHLARRVFHLEQTNARLKEALGWFMGRDARFQTAVGGNPNAAEDMLAESDKRLREIVVCPTTN